MTIPPTDHLRLERALAAIDAVHAQDPRHTQDETGQPVPYELLYARRLSDTLAEFAPRRCSWPCAPSTWSGGAFRAKATPWTDPVT